jgi:hypothetical protein
VRVTVHVAGSEDEAPPELEGIWPLPVLAVPGGARTQPGDDVVWAERVDQGRRPELSGPVRLALRVDEEREADPGLPPERASVHEVSEPDRGQMRPTRQELRLLVAQLRDVLAAEDSAVVAEEHEGRGRVGPEGA